MAKIGIFKKVAALATAIAIVLCFAATAGAVEVTTLTSYVDGDVENILVEVTIAGEDIVDKSVSYYAYNEEGPVYIDQIEDGSSEIFFDYVTSTANLDSDVKIGYTGASAAEDAKVDGNTVTWGDSVVYIPTEATEATVTFATDATDVISYTAEGADIVSKPVVTAGESITVVLENIEGAVTLNITVKAQATIQLIDAAYVYSNGHDDIRTEGEASFVDTIWGDKKLTAIAKATGTEDDYGVIVADVDDPSDMGIYAAAGKTANGFFAVQLIDNAADEDVLLADDSYKVAAYAVETISEFKTVEIKDLRTNN